MLSIHGTDLERRESMSMGVNEPPKRCVDQLGTGTTIIDLHWPTRSLVIGPGWANSIWSPSTGANGGAGTFSGAAARAAGLHNRPERETARNLLSWWDCQSEERKANMKAGLSAEREAELIAAWKARIA